MNPVPREPVKHWLTLACAEPQPSPTQIERQEHESQDAADKYADEFLIGHHDGEVRVYKFEYRSTAKLVIEKDGGRSAT